MPTTQVTVEFIPTPEVGDLSLRINPHFSEQKRQVIEGQVGNNSWPNSMLP
jgi:hypothetical protein